MRSGCCTVVVGCVCVQSEGMVNDGMGGEERKGGYFGLVVVCDGHVVGVV